jgi:hypothetical protein
MTSPNLRPSYGLPGSALIGVNAQEIVLIGILTLNWSSEDQWIEAVDHRGEKADRNNSPLVALSRARVATAASNVSSAVILPLPSTISEHAPRDGLSCASESMAFGSAVSGPTVREAIRGFSQFMKKSRDFLPAPIARELWEAKHFAIHTALSDRIG